MARAGLIIWRERQRPALTAPPYPTEDPGVGNLPQVHQTSNIPVPDDLDLRQFIKNARKAHRKAHPDQVKKRGRNSEEEAVLEAIKIIFLSGIGYSKRWSQERWTVEIVKIVNFHITRRTVQKHLKEIYNRNLFPLHMIPASFVKNLSQEQQTYHWFAVALADTIDAAHRAGASPGPTRIEYKDLYDRYHQLLDKYKVPRPS